MKGLDFSLEKEEIKKLKNKAFTISEKIERAIQKKGISAEVFMGGSFAKGTLAKSDDYDIDFFVRFDWKYEDISSLMEKILKDLEREGLKIIKMHGSRDYFRIEDGEVTFEIVPVVKIKNPREARNVTDLSFFHVNYVKKRLNSKLQKEVLILKKFFKAQKVYGAESYIGGFSGYGAECLIIYYKSFEKTIKELLKIKIGGRIVIDPAKQYKNKNEVFFNMNESKIHGPIVLVDPTYKERNVLSALNWESFLRFQEAGKKYLKRPSKNYFILKKFDEKEFREGAENNKLEFAKIILKTEKQEGDIAGTKMKKFCRLLTQEIRKYFEIKREEFVYEGAKNSEFYLMLSKKEQVIKIGPPLNMKKEVAAFKKKNKVTYEKNGFVHAKMKIDFSAKRFLTEFAKTEKNRKMKEMHIIEMKVEN